MTHQTRSTDTEMEVDDAPAQATMRDDPLVAELPDVVTQELTFGIRLVDTPDGRSKASMLIHRMYGWRGFSGNHSLSVNPNRVTLMASQQDNPVGTLSIGLDSDEGLLADGLFTAELEKFRGPGDRICEVIKFAFDIQGHAKAYQAALFHLAVITARDVHKCNHMFIEVQPRHKGFFERALGFQQLGEIKLNPRVNVRGMLMHVDLVYMTEQIQLYGGKGAAAGLRSFYPWFYSPREEIGIINRMLKLSS